MGLTIVQRGLAYFHLEYLVLLPKAEPNFFQPSSPSASRGGSFTRLSEVMQPVLGTRIRPGLPAFSLWAPGRTSRQGAWSEGWIPTLRWRDGKGIHWVFLGGLLADWTSSPRSPYSPEPLSTHSPAFLLPHSHPPTALNTPSFQGRPLYWAVDTQPPFGCLKVKVEQMA